MNTSLWILIAGIVIGGAAVYFLLHALWRCGYYTIYSILRFLMHHQPLEDQHPRSVRNCENLVLDQILKDFPDFNLGIVKNQVRTYILKNYGTKTNFRIHKLVLSDYRRDQNQKRIFFQASACWKEKQLIQRRLEVTMQFQHARGQAEGPALTCPNCGAALGFDDLECQYCGTRIPDSRDEEWSFTTIKES